MVNRKREAIVFFSILLILYLSQILDTVNVYSCPSVISLNPASVKGPPPDIGTSYTLTLNFNGQTDLWSWKIGLKWDPSVLDLQGVTEGSFLKSDGNATIFEVGTINHEIGTLNSVSSRRIVPSGLTGTGDLATFTFIVVGYSASASQIQIVGDELRTSTKCNPLISHESTGSTIIITPPPPHNPTAIISSPADNSVYYVGESINLDGSSSQSGINIYGVRPITSWEWTLSGAYNGSFEGKKMRFIPIQSGDITIQLTVSAPDGTPQVAGYNPINAKSVTIHIKPKTIPPNEIKDTTPPVVLFNIYGLEKDNTTYINKTLTFDASKSYDPNNGIINSYIWDFGDKYTENSKIMNHTYSTNGFFTVKLACTDASGNIAWKTANITVKKPPKNSLDLYTLNFSTDGKGINNKSSPFQPYSKIKLLANYKIEEIPVQNSSITFVIKRPDSTIPFLIKNGEKTDQYGTATITFLIPSSKKPGDTNLLGDWIAEAHVENFDEVRDTMPFKVDWALDLQSEESSMKILDSQNKPTLHVLGDQAATIEFHLVNNFEYSVNQNVSIQVFDGDQNKIFQKTMEAYNFPPGKNILKVPFIVSPDAVLGNASIKISIAPEDYDPNAFIPSKTFKGIKILTIGAQLSYGTLLEKSVQEGYPLNMTILVDNKAAISSNATIRIYCNQTQIDVIKTKLIQKSLHVITYTWNTTNYRPGPYIISASIDDVKYSTLPGNSIILGNAVITNTPSTFFLQWFGFITILTAVTSTVIFVTFFGRDPPQANKN